jgi:hypothetical protein
VIWAVIVVAGWFPGRMVSVYVPEVADCPVAMVKGPTGVGSPPPPVVVWLTEMADPVLTNGFLPASTSRTPARKVPLLPTPLAVHVTAAGFV